MVVARSRAVVVERGRRVVLSRERSGNRRILRMAAIEFGIRIVIVHGRAHMLRLERSRRKVVLVHRRALLGAGRDGCRLGLR